VRRLASFGDALSASEAHEKPTALALVIGPPAAVVIGAQPPGRQVGVQGLDRLQRRFQATLDLFDVTHRRGWVGRRLPNGYLNW
jgi:hypothetical protein